MWGPRDEFHFAWKRLQRRLHPAGAGRARRHRASTRIASSAGSCARSLDADSPYADAAVHGDGLTSLQFRRTKGAITEQIESASDGRRRRAARAEGRHVHAVRRALRRAVHGRRRSPDLALGDEVYVGLFLCSHNPDVVEQALFRDVRIIRPAKAGFVPYRDYIGSRARGPRRRDRPPAGRAQLGRAVRGAQLDARRERAHLQHQRPPEGRGRLHRFDLATRQSTLIDTGFAIRNNNDHVLSFDGTQLGISDQSARGGQSTIYTLPAAGGTPKRITPQTPSYLHGWSPDGSASSTPAGANDDTTSTRSRPTAAARRSG